jgi:hypothetical protein
MKALKFVGYVWCVAVVIGYLAYWMLSEHGGGILSQSGTFDIWLIALACLPGVALIKLSKSRTRQS